ncbi:gamma-glutamyltranspeptidase family protein [Sphingomonas sp. S17]|nr:gamma-glutamyltranspeptidase family protein [Sphingomonas sp. S17]
MPSLPKRWEAGADRFLRPDVTAGDRPVGASFSSRTAAYGLNGAAGTAHPLATQAGIDILRQGGSAVDVAIAINACLGFLEPTSSGIGGNGYAMIWDPKQRKVVGLAGSGASPRGLSLETVRSRARGGALPPLGAVTVSVPGAVDAWWTMHQRYGRLPWAQLFEPAIAHAEAGVPVPDIIAYYTRRSMAAFRRPGNGIEETANALRTYGLADGRGPAAGQVFRNPDLARTYREGRAGRLLCWRHRARRRPLLQADRRLAALRGHGRTPVGMGGAAPHGVSRRGRLCARREHPGHRHAPDAQHPREFRPGRCGLPVAIVDPSPGGGEAARL